ncbi:MAG TPA: DUF2946 family protein [Rhodocyclaceae bacterium]|nr:DUF2946 family protein [Rhodocyclaceae bacterium]
MIERWLAILLLLLIPLQMSFAAVHEYLEHATDVAESSIHQHSHSHVDSDSDHTAFDPPSGDGDSHDDGFGHIHFGHAHLVTAPSVVAASPLSNGIIDAAPAFYRSIPARRLERPPLHARHPARFDEAMTTSM